MTGFCDVWNQESLALVTSWNYEKIAYLEKNREIGEFETFSGPLRPRLCLCEPTVCHCFFK